MNRVKIALPIMISIIGLVSAASVFGQFVETVQKEIKIKVKNFPDSPHQVDDPDPDNPGQRKPGRKPYCD